MEQAGYQNLIVWQKGMELANLMYIYTAQLPKHEQYALSSQATRASISIPSNIAELITELRKMLVVLIKQKRDST